MRYTTILGQLELTVANRYLPRLIGLLGRHTLPPHTGILLTPCASIHTFGMRMPISVICLSRDGVVMRAVDCLVPNRILIAPRGTYEVVELGAHALGVHSNLVGQLFWS